MAELTLDGKRKGPVSPAGLRVSGLSPGSHHALFTIKDFMSLEKTFDVKPGETAEVRADFPQRGMLQVAVGNPDWNGAEVLLDGQKIGNAPLTKTIAAGIHKLEVRLAGWEPFVRSVEVVPDDRTRVSAELKRP